MRFLSWARKSGIGPDTLVQLMMRVLSLVSLAIVGWIGPVRFGSLWNSRVWTLERGEVGYGGWDLSGNAVVPDGETDDTVRLTVAFEVVPVAAIKNGVWIPGGEDVRVV